MTCDAMKTIDGLRRAGVIVTAKKSTKRQSCSVQGFPFWEGTRGKSSWEAHYVPPTRLNYETYWEEPRLVRLVGRFRRILFSDVEHCLTQFDGRR